MQIVPHIESGQIELKAREATVRLGKTITIGDFTLPGPGEYEVAGVMAEVTDTTSRLHVEGLAIGYLASHRKLSDKELEVLGPVDIFFFTIGAAALPQKEALALVAQIEAPLMIPVATSQADLDAFCESGVSCERQSGPLKITRSQLSTDGSKIVALS